MKSEDMILEDILELMNSINITHMPTVKDMRANNKALEHDIYKAGGSRYISEKYNIPMKKACLKWDEDILMGEIVNVINSLKIDHFPTKEEMDFVTNGYGLSNKVYKTGGSKHWAKRLGLNLKSNTDTHFGWDGENILSSKINEMGYKIERLTTNCVYDFLINDCVRVDCKISRIYHGASGSFYSYNLERPNPDCDVFILIALDDNGNTRFMVVPQQVLKGQSQVSIGLVNSKWYKYENRYDLIDKYISFYKSLIS